MTKIGFIGLGLMGEPMAQNLEKAGYPLVVFDIVKEKMTAFADRGAQAAASPSEVAANSDVILTMLPNSPDVEQAILGADGVLEGIGDGQVVVDMSSIAPLVSRKAAAAVEAKGGVMLDAPVSGGVEKAKAGTLAFMVGGSEQAFEQVKAILEVMGGSVTLVGPSGAGQTTKLVNQMIVASNIAVIAEAMTLGKKAGVDPEKIFAAIRGGLAASQCLEDKAPRMFDGSFEPGFRIQLHAKDLANALETSRELHTAVPMTAQLMEMMQALINDGHDQDDHGGLAQFYEKLNSVSLQRDE